MMTFSKRVLVFCLLFGSTSVAILVSLPFVLLALFTSLAKGFWDATREVTLTTRRSTVGSLYTQQKTKSTQLYQTEQSEEIGKNISKGLKRRKKAHISPIRGHPAATH